MLPFIWGSQIYTSLYSPSLYKGCNLVVMSTCNLFAMALTHGRTAVPLEPSSNAKTSGNQEDDLPLASCRDAEHSSSVLERLEDVHHFEEGQPVIGADAEYFFPLQDAHEGDDILHHVLLLLPNMKCSCQSLGLRTLMWPKFMTNISS